MRPFSGTSYDTAKREDGESGPRSSRRAASVPAPSGEPEEGRSIFRQAAGGFDRHRSYRARAGHTDWRACRSVRNLARRVAAQRKSAGSSEGANINGD